MQLRDYRWLWALSTTLVSHEHVFGNETLTLLFRNRRTHTRRRVRIPYRPIVCDNLVATTVVTVDGRILRASEDSNPDLFWGIRGGGSNFGIVTQFVYRVHNQGDVFL